MLKGFPVKEGRTETLVLQYKYDTIVFLEDSLDMVENLKGMLYWFEAASGLHINSIKTKSIALLKWEVVMKPSGNGLFKGVIT